MNNKISMKEFKFTPFTNFIFHKIYFFINKGSIGSPYFLVIIVLYTLIYQIYSKSLV